ncbi:MAG: flagellar hook-length control protein FliK [Legionella sp.]|nr:flagellar hook-length control protein FliK [Legionella sp.]
MLDLKNVMPGSLLTMDSLLNAQDGIELESLSVINENQSSDNDDPNDFILLFSQITSSPPEPEKIVLTESEPVQLPVTTETVSNNQVDMEQAINTLDENVAVAWINSDYYQAELNNEKMQSSEAVEHLSTQAVEIPGVVSKTGELPLPTPVQSELLAAMDSLLPVQENVLENQAPQTNERLVQQDPINNDVVETVETHTFIKPMDIAKTAVLAEDILPEAVSNRVSLQAMPVETRKQTALSDVSDEDSSSEEHVETKLDSVESSTLVKPRESLISEMLISAPITENESIATDNGLINSLSASTQQSVLYSQEKSDMLPNTMPQFLDLPTNIEQQPEWSQHFSEQVVWLGQQGQGINRAVIKLHPEDLGPIEINIKVVNGSASISIASHSQQVRDVIDQSLPKLQEMMAEQGLSLSEVTVESETDARQFAQQDNEARDEFVAYEDEEMMITPLRKKATHQGAVDLFA